MCASGLHALRGPANATVGALMAAPKCRVPYCGHVERSHLPACKTCSCPGFQSPTSCPLGIFTHNTPHGHSCNCVPGQQELQI